MTAHELARKLLEGEDLLVTVRGYEGGVDEVGYVQDPQPIHYDANTEWYRGRHEYHEGEGTCVFCDFEEPVVPETLAIHLVGGS